MKNRVITYILTLKVNGLSIITRKTQIQEINIAINEKNWATLAATNYNAPFLNKWK